MKTYIALLRGINVSGQKKIKMADLRATLENEKLQKVKTYIQSGNIVFDYEEGNEVNLEEIIRQAILSDFGFEVPTLVTTAKRLEHLVVSNPFLGKEEGNRLYFVLLKQRPAADLVQAFNTESFVNEAFHITDDCVYLCCKNGYGNAKLDNNLIEKKLKVAATTRNLRTMQKLIALAKET